MGSITSSIDGREEVIDKIAAAVRDASMAEIGAGLRLAWGGSCSLSAITVYLPPYPLIVQFGPPEVEAE